MALANVGLLGVEDAAADQVGFARPCICHLGILMRLIWHIDCATAPAEARPSVAASWPARRPVKKEQSAARRRLIYGAALIIISTTDQLWRRRNRRRNADEQGTW